MATNTVLTLAQLKRAVQIQEQIEKLQAELAAILGQSGGAKRGRKPGKKAKTTGGEIGDGAPVRKKKAKRVMSAEAREKIAAAQRKRWARAKKAAV